MALYDNNNLLAAVGGQNLDPNTTPYATLQNYQNNGQRLLNQPMPQTMYSPWQALSYALSKFEGRNEQDSSQNINQENTNNWSNEKENIINAVKGFVPSAPNLETGSVTPASGVVQGGTGTLNVNPNQAGYDSKLINFESGGDPTAVKGSHKGLGQFGPNEEKEFGINDQNRTDPTVQVSAINKERQMIDAALTPVLGRPPTDGEAYLAHQQGISGASAILRNPDQPAWQTIRRFYKTDGDAQRAIAGNLPDALRGSDPSQISGAQFAQGWTSKFGPTQPTSQTNAAQAQPQPNQAQPNPTETGSIERPVQNGQPAATRQPDFSDLLNHLDRGTPVSEPAISAQESMALSRMSPEQQNNYLDQRKAAFHVDTFDTGLGTFWKQPGMPGQSARIGFLPKTQLKESSINGITVPTAVGINQNGTGISSQYAIPGAEGTGIMPGTNVGGGEGGGQGGGQGGPSAPIQQPGQQGSGAPAPNGVSAPNPALANPNVQGRDVNAGPLNPLVQLNNAVEQNKNNLEIKKGLDQKRATSLEGDYQNLQQSVAPTDKLLQGLRTEKAILNDPHFFSGTGASTAYDVSKLFDTLGIQTPANMDRSQAMQLYTKERADTILNNLKSLQGLGAVRNAEISVIQDSSGLLANTPGSLRALNDIATRTAQRNLDVAALARQYRQNHGGYMDSGWDSYVANWRDKNPLFTDKELTDYQNMFKSDKQKETDATNAKAKADATARNSYYEGQTANKGALTYSKTNGWLKTDEYNTLNKKTAPAAPVQVPQGD